MNSQRSSIRVKACAINLELFIPVVFNRPFHVYLEATKDGERTIRRHCNRKLRRVTNRFLAAKGIANLGQDVFQSVISVHGTVATG